MDAGTFLSPTLTREFLFLLSFRLTDFAGMVWIVGPSKTEITKK